MICFPVLSYPQGESKRSRGQAGKSGWPLPAAQMLERTEGVRHKILSLLRIRGLKMVRCGAQDSIAAGI
ncbi:hypothetical protein CHH26_11785 [Qipengyuania flava]|nr:hypothetical protein CHH26_11785 [Qipengyuania flava]